MTDWTGKNFQVINNHRWYYRLVPADDGRGLMDDHPVSTLGGQLIIGLQQETDNKLSRLFSVFPSYLEFFTYRRSLRLRNYCCYEIILGEYPQKPHFDLDLKGVTEATANQVLNDLLDRVEQVLTELGVTLNPGRDVLIYSSHSREKYSFHLVLHHHAHLTNVEARLFYDRVMSGLPATAQPFVDMAVYSTRQNFRLLGHSKPGANRPKILVSSWVRSDGSVLTHEYEEEIESEDHHRLIDFQESLISSVDSCLLLPALAVESAGKPRYETTADLTTELVEEAMSLLRSQAEKCPYSYQRTEGNLILLKRLKPSRCRVCQRIHETENPYLRVVSREDGRWSVQFCCRRSKDNASSELGIIGMASEGGATKEDKDKAFQQEMLVSVLAMLRNREMGTSLVKIK